uniref:Serpentine receptor class gamma n=1 Tax=Caenorhabditis tropicalis TaxID=1561998 RepID=A0A1I7UGT0_9PELO
MILLINDSYHLWIPIYMFNATEYISPFLYSLLVFEFSISLFCVFYTLKLCSSIWRIRVFHVNMSILAIAYLIQYLECFIGKWFMIAAQNYKRHRRTYISFTILFISHTVTLYLSYLTFTEQVEMVSTVVGCMICVTLSCVLAYRILVCIGIYIFLLCIILFTLFFDVFPSLNLLLIFLLENCIYLNPLVICSVIFYSIDPWKKSLIPRGFIRSSTSHTSKSSIGRQQTTDLYFQQLQSSWLRK